MAAPASSISSQKQHIKKFFLGSAIWTWTYLKMLFLYGKHLLANNMTGQANDTLWKLGGG